MNAFNNAWDWLDGKKRTIATVLAVLTGFVQVLQGVGLPIPHLDVAISLLGKAAAGVGALGLMHAAYKAKMATAQR